MLLLLLLLLLVLLLLLLLLLLTWKSTYSHMARILLPTTKDHYFTCSHKYRNKIVYCTQFSQSAEAEVCKVSHGRTVKGEVMGACRVHPLSKGRETFLRQQFKVFIDDGRLLVGRTR